MSTLFLLQCDIPGDEPDIHVFTSVDLAIEFAIREIMKCDDLSRDEILVLTGSNATDRYSPSVLAGILPVDDADLDPDESDILQYTVSEIELNPTN